MLIDPHSMNKVNKFNQTISLDMRPDKQYTQKAESAVVVQFWNYYVGTTYLVWVLIMGYKGKNLGNPQKLPCQQ